MNNEPVAWINVEKRRLEWDKPTLWETPTAVKLDRIPLYTHPVKELTDEEIIELFEHPDDFNCIEFARAIMLKVQEADKIEPLGPVNIGGVHFKNGKEVK